MNIYVIENYVNRLTKDDIRRFALKQGITLGNDEVAFIYTYIKKNYKNIIFGNPKDVLSDIKDEVKANTYNKIVNLYMQYKDKLELLAKTIRENS